MNVDGGYWVLGLQMEAIERADRAELHVDDWAIALASDGFLRLTDMFGRLGVYDLLSINSREEFEEYYSQLRTLEQVDGSHRNHPRAKIRARSEERRVGEEGVRRERAGGWTDQ